MDTLGRDAEGNTAMVMRALARRAVACEGWKWMRGMRAFAGSTCEPIRIVTADFAPWEGDRIPLSLDDKWPDFTDPATLGCLLALVREALESDVYTCRLIAPALNRDGWALMSAHNAILHEGIFPTEAEALVVALEAAGVEE